MLHTSPNFLGKLLVLALLLAATGGCARAVRIETVDGLAQALKQGGIAYDTTERLDFSGIDPARIDEGLGLTGEKLQVVILRITDERTYKQMGNAALLLAIVKDRAPNMPQQPPELYQSKPFVIVIRAEPETGQVRAALKRLLREDRPSK